MSLKGGFRRASNEYRKHTRQEKKKKKPNVFIWQINHYKTYVSYLVPQTKQEEKTKL